MAPVRWHQAREAFEERRAALNAVLAFAGLTFRADGEVARRRPATTHSEAQLRTQRLRDELQRRNAHAEVFRYCTRELLAEDCFGACSRRRRASPSASGR